MNGHAVASRRTWLRSRWLPAALAVVPTLLTLWGASAPGGYFGIALWALVAWLVTGTLWLVVAALAVVTLPRPRSGHLKACQPLLSFPALLVGTFLLAGSGLASWISFQAHRPGLEHLVAEVAAAPGQRLHGQRVGLFAVPNASLDRASGCTEISVYGAGGLFGSTGFAHCPSKPPVSVTGGGDGTTYRHLHGAWFTYTFTW